SVGTEVWHREMQHRQVHDDEEGRKAQDGEGEPFLAPRSRRRSQNRIRRHLSSSQSRIEHRRCDGAGINPETSTNIEVNWAWRTSPLPPPTGASVPGTLKRSPKGAKRA